ncbi:DinB family protein [Paenibacillus albus]|uniref:DinB family protein n=1 Tax=Paenibacillus albus TaxID=2495582 RepID=A0A3Q8X5Y3_9BACL|nr:DinB family protein [Paenibacillus albus]AZN40839.1 DinB family protein [Paenibacillus albus]
MPTFPVLMVTFESLMSFAASLRTLSIDEWTSPLESGKWSTQEVMAHILLWDRYFLSAAIAPIADGTPLTYKHINYDLFNANAAAYAKTISQDELITACIAVRGELVERLKSLDETQQNEVYYDGDGHPFTILKYLEDFVGHDAHHREQIERFRGSD